ncbi:MAG: hypothetical protein JXR14_10795 [Paracoccaceae bacterium]
MEYEKAIQSVETFIQQCFLEGGIFSKYSDEAWQALSLADCLMKNPGAMLEKARKDRQAFQQVRIGAAMLFRLLDLKETGKLEDWERENFSNLHLPSELFPWLSRYLAEEGKSSQQLRGIGERKGKKYYPVGVSVTSVSD